MRHGEESLLTASWVSQLNQAKSFRYGLVLMNSIALSSVIQGQISRFCASLCPPCLNTSDGMPSDPGVFPLDICWMTFKVSARFGGSGSCSCIRSCGVSLMATSLTSNGLFRRLLKCSVQRFKMSSRSVSRVHPSAAIKWIRPPSFGPYIALRFSKKRLTSLWSAASWSSMALSIHHLFFILKLHGLVHPPPVLHLEAPWPCPSTTCSSFWSSMALSIHHLFFLLKLHGLVHPPPVLPLEAPWPCPSTTCSSSWSSMALSIHHLFFILKLHGLVHPPPVLHLSKFRIDTNKNTMQLIKNKFKKENRKQIERMRSITVMQKDA